MKCKMGPDIFIWKSDKAGNFTMRSAWEMVRLRADEQDWMKWIWHSQLPMKLSPCMWKAMLRYLPVDDRIHQLGIPFVSACNCNEDRKTETLDHLLSKGEVVC